MVQVLREDNAATPAASDASDLETEPIEFRYVGQADGVEARLARQAGLEFAAISAGQLRIRNPLKLARNAAAMTLGLWQAHRLLSEWRPDVVFVTGGYVCAPVVWAAHRRGVSILIYLPDITPGLAVQRLARYATRVAVTFPEVAAHFPGKAVVTGYPVRAELRGRSMSKAQARAAFDLDPDRRTLLAFGGSRGARDINIALAAILPRLLEQAQVIHITGEFDWPQAQKRASNLPKALRHRYRQFPYLHDEMIPALHAADLAVARAGASTLGEFPALGLPAILVPLPISGQHQRPNARYLAERGAAVIVRNAEMSKKLLPTIEALLAAPERLDAMSRAAASLARPDAARRIADALLELARSAPRRTS